MSISVIKPGRVVPINNSSGSDIDSGDGVVIKSGASVGALGLALVDILDGETQNVMYSGEVDAPAVSANTADIWDNAYWDAGAGNITTTSTGNTLAGRFFRTKTAGQTTARLLLNGLPPSDRV